MYANSSRLYTLASTHSKCSQAAFLLSHLMSVVEHLEPAWSRAFLRRTRLLDSDFQGDVLAVISRWFSLVYRSLLTAMFSSHDL